MGRVTQQNPHDTRLNNRNGAVVSQILINVDNYDKLRCRTCHGRPARHRVLPSGDYMYIYTSHRNHSSETCIMQLGAAISYYNNNNNKLLVFIHYKKNTKWLWPRTVVTDFV